MFLITFKFDFMPHILKLLRFGFFHFNIESAIELGRKRIGWATASKPMILTPGVYKASDNSNLTNNGIGTMEIGFDFFVFPDYFKNLDWFEFNGLRMDFASSRNLLYYLTKYDIDEFIVL